ncbi:hypothetical protein [Heliorestis convoluta]|uniref:Uncharacterized protein n=1 Tax=Heliorestis convoluta TaxID=356322 RepID=A0A5Q2N1B9_9FIRM|nr:hypothetical protein [Heliorestis convoluta]QGG48597.1 hypothetical protein FTV88_2504 [Heliorestis convoluta]
MTQKGKGKYKRYYFKVPSSSPAGQWLESLPPDYRNLALEVLINNALYHPDKARLFSICSGLMEQEQAPSAPTSFVSTKEKVKKIPDSSTKISSKANSKGGTLPADKPSIPSEVQDNNGITFDVQAFASLGT